MFLLFYGADTYRLRQKLNDLKTKFVTSSLGDTNLVILDGKSVTYEEMVRQILALPFLARKRLVILENFLKVGKKEHAEKLTEFIKKDKVPESTVLVFVEEGSPDKRGALFKKLNAPKIAQEFKLLEIDQLRRWVKGKVDELGATIEPDALAKLIEYIGSDLWRMSNEITKLTAYGLQLTAQNVELLVESQVQSNVFDLMDAVAGKNTARALKEMNQLILTGANELYILTMIVSSFRNLLIVKDLKERNPSINQWQLAKIGGLHPFVAGKNLQLVNHYSIDELKYAYKTLLDFDSRTKVGKIEPKAAIELLILKLTTQNDEIRMTNDEKMSKL